MLEGAVIVLRWLQFAGAAALFGVALFQLYAPTPDDLARMRGRVLAAAGTVVLASLAGLIAQTAVMAGSLEAALDPTTLSMVAFQMSLGQAHLARAALGLVAAGLILSGARGTLLWWGLVLLGLGVCATFALSGHAGATEGAWGPPHRISDGVHVVAAGTWIGALVAFLAMVGQRAQTDRQTLYRALSGFSGVGTLAVAALVVTGLVNAWVLIGPAALPTALGTAYGALLALKLVVFAGMLGLAAANRFQLTPALGRAEDEAATQAAVNRLRLSLILETTLGLLVLALVAALGTLAPPAALI